MKFYNVKLRCINRIEELPIEEYAEGFNVKNTLDSKLVNVDIRISTFITEIYIELVNSRSNAYEIGIGSIRFPYNLCHCCYTSPSLCRYIEDNLNNNEE